MNRFFFETFVCSLVLCAGCTVLGRADANCIEDLGRISGQPSNLKVIALDRTTALGPGSAAELEKKIVAWPRPGDRVLLVAFGGGAGTELITILADENFEHLTLSDKVISETSSRLYREYVACAGRTDFEKRTKLRQLVSSVLTNPDTSSKGASPIFDALKAISAGYVNSPGELMSRALLLVSDGIEHSRTAEPSANAVSFYTGEGDESVREIDAEATLNALTKGGRMSDFSAVKVFHAGFAQPASSVRAVRRSRYPAEIATLSKFWTAYWAAARAKFVGFGQPVPLQPF